MQVGLNRLQKLPMLILGYFLTPRKGNSAERKHKEKKRSFSVRKKRLNQALFALEFHADLVAAPDDR